MCVKWVCLYACTIKGSFRFVCSVCSVQGRVAACVCGLKWGCGCVGCAAPAPTKPGQGFYTHDTITNQTHPLELGEIVAVVGQAELHHGRHLLVVLCVERGQGGQGGGYIRRAGGFGWCVATYRPPIIYTRIHASFHRFHGSIHLSAPGRPWPRWRRRG